MVQNGKNWCNQCKCSCHEVASEFLAMNTPDPPHGTLNSCFGEFRTILVPLGLFRRLTKLGSKRTELVRLMQKFVPRSCVGIFDNDRIRSTPLDTKPMFLCVSYCLGAFGTISSPYKIKFKTGRTGVINAKVCTVNSRRNFSQRTDLIHPIGP